jgi:hypothetical protein
MRRRTMDGIGRREPINGRMRGAIGRGATASLGERNGIEWKSC